MRTVGTRDKYKILTHTNVQIMNGWMDEMVNNTMMPREKNKNGMCCSVTDTLMVPQERQ